MIDLAQFDTATGSEEGRWIEPVDLTGKKIGIKILVYGPDSKRYGKIIADKNRRLYKSLANVSNGLDPVEEEQTEGEQEAQFYAKITGAWESLSDEKVSWEGQDFPFTEANAMKLYLLVPSIKAQVKMFADHRRNFTKPVSVD